MNRKLNKIKFVIYLCLTIYPLLLLCCADIDREKTEREKAQTEVAYSPEKDSKIQHANLEIEKQKAAVRFPCDTLSLKEYILNNYPAGTYLVDFDKASAYDIPKSAVLYLDAGFILAVIAKSGADKRLIETKNIVGYDQSFIDLDSTELGTPFFYLTMFECSKNSFNKIWETPVPSHGGFNNFSVEKWWKSFPVNSAGSDNINTEPIQYVKVNFHYGQGIGHINYNYFLIDGLTGKPHLLMTYEGINFKRTILNYNNDNYPDYYEYLYYDTGTRVYAKDSIAFVWDTTRQVYINTRNSKQTRQY